MKGIEIVTRYDTLEKVKRRWRRKIRIFSNGSQCAGWLYRNCERCRAWNCSIKEAITMAYFGDGTVNREIAKRMGYFENKNSLTWDCPARKRKKDV